MKIGKQESCRTPKSLARREGTGEKPFEKSGKGNGNQKESISLSLGSG